MTNAYFEFGAMIAAGPHEGMFIKTFRTLGAAEEWIANPPRGQEGPYVIRRRHVAVGDWGIIPRERP